jgi:hypothetical protein
MSKKTFIPILFILSLISLVYAVYRSSAERITEISNGRQIVYGEPQHGLVLGLCIFSGMCLLGIALLLLDRFDRTELRQEPPTTAGKRTTTATNYPQ